MNVSHNQMSIAARFSASSNTYDEVAVIQPMVVENVFKMIVSPRSIDQILEIGCGTGLLTGKIIQRFPSARIDAVDISAKMVMRSRTRLAANGRIRWSVADVLDLPESVMYPLIVSSSSLHWISPISDGMTKLSRLLKRNGYLVFALMVHGTLGELRDARLRVAPQKPPQGSLPSAPEVRQSLQYAGLCILEEFEETVRIHYPSASILLRRIHDQGLTGGRVSASMLPMNRDELRHLVMDYDARYKSDKGVYATYHVAYFKAVKSSCQSEQK